MIIIIKLALLFWMMMKFLIDYFNIISTNYNVSLYSGIEDVTVLSAL